MKKGAKEVKQGPRALGRRREGAGRRQRECGVNLYRTFFSHRLQQWQTNGSTPASAKREIRKEIRGDKIEHVVTGSCLIHSSGCPCEPGRR